MNALSSPMFRRYYAASAASVQALWAQRVALGWIAWEVSSSPSYVGFVAALSMAPTLISGPVFGVLVDRANILRAAGWTTACMAAVLLAGTILHLTFGLGVFSLAILALLVGIISSAHHPVRMSLAPRLVPKEQVSSVIALSSVNFNTARLTAPVWAGGALVWLGAGGTLLIAAALYLPMLLVLPSLSARPLPQTLEKPPILRALLEGIQRVQADPLVLRAIVLTAGFAILVRGYLEILPIIAEGVHQRGPTGLGLLTSAAGGGALLAAAVKTAGWGDTPDRISGSVRFGLVLGTATLALVGWIPRWDVALGATAVLGFASTYCGVSLQSVVQSNVPDDYRGRVMSLWVVVGFGAVALGALALGALAEVFGVSETLIFSGAIGALVMGYVTLLPR